LGVYTIMEFSIAGWVNGCCGFNGM